MLCIQAKIEYHPGMNTLKLPQTLNKPSSPLPTLNPKPSSFRNPAHSGARNTLGCQSRRERAVCSAGCRSSQPNHLGRRLRKTLRLKPRSLNPNLPIWHSNLPIWHRIVELLSILGTVILIWDSIPHNSS